MGWTMMIGFMRNILGALLMSTFLSGLWADGAFATSKTVSLPVIKNKTISPRVIYVENPRFPQLTKAELATIVQTAADMVKGHFGVTMEVPSTIETSQIDEVFPAVVSQAPEAFEGLMGDFRTGKVDWPTVREMLIEQISGYGALDEQIAFASPYLTSPLASKTVDALAETVIETFKNRLDYWTKAKLADGSPIIGEVPGRPDLPVNEYGYWTLMAKLGIEAEIVLTNQFIASVEYIPTPIHTAIRGGITGGSTEYNPASKFGASVWMSTAPFFLDDAQVRTLRGEKNYSREEALRYTGILLAHEIGHLVLHLGHPWSNTACLMRPAEVLDFAAWDKSLNPAKCKIGSDPEMEIGVLDIPIW